MLYVSKLKKPIYALPYYLNSIGYQTFAMHNNYSYYYNRNKVYPDLGFEKFISLENMIAKKILGKWLIWVVGRQMILFLIQLSLL